MSNPLSPPSRSSAPTLIPGETIIRGRIRRGLVVRESGPWFEVSDAWVGGDDGPGDTPLVMSRDDVIALARMAGLIVSEPEPYHLTVGGLDVKIPRHLARGAICNLEFCLECDEILRKEDGGV